MDKKPTCEELEDEIKRLNQELRKKESNLDEIQELAKIKQIEKELRQNYERYRKSQEIAHVGNWEYNIQTTIFWGSDEAKRIYGFDVNTDSFTTDEVENCILERERVHQALIDLIEKDKKYNLEFDIITKDTKKRKTIISLAELEKDENGNPLKITGVIEDITDRKLTEKELRISLEKYRILFEFFPIGVSVTDFKGNLLETNPESERLLGVSAKEHTERKIDGQEWKIIRQNGTTMPVDEYASVRALKTQQMIKNVEMGIIKENNEITWINVQAAPIPLERYGVIITYNDITDRKIVEESLKTNNANLLSILENTEDIICSRDMNHRLIFYNTAFSKIIRKLFNIEAFIGMKTLNYLPEEAQKYWEPILTRVLSGERYLCELRWDFGNGDVRDYEISFNPIYKDGTIIGYVEFNREITSHKKAEKELIEAKESAEIANQSKSSFLANMSHEIRTPMNAIIGSSKILIKMNSTDEQKKYLNIIKTAGENLLSIVNDILDLSKIEAGKVNIEYQDTVISDILNNVQKIIYPLALAKGIEFLCERENKNFPVIKADKTRLKQILLNLVNNAIKFTFQGLVSINVSIDNETDTHITLHFTVKDTGIGIQQDKINQLFQPFSQVSKIKTGGTGLGLTISKKLVELMRGTIHVESEEDKGSKFWFVITFEKGSLSTTQLGESIQDTHKKKNIQKDLKILVAEDNIFNQEVIQGFLKDYMVTVVNDGKEAVKILENNSFDVILMDIQMPEMDGITATKIIRDQNSKVLNHDIPIIAMTAYAMKEDRNLCLQSGMNGYVAKPIDFKKLTQEIEKLWIPDLKPHTSLNHYADLSNRSIFDSSSLLRVIDNDKTLALRLIKRFLDDQGYSKYLLEIKHAIDEKNAEKLQNKAHSLKGMIGYFSSSGKELTSKLQEMGRIKDLSSANETYESLKELISNLKPLLEDFMDAG